MTTTLDFIQPSDKAVSELKSKLDAIGVSVTNEMQVNNGAGTKLSGICKGQPVSIVIYYNRAKGFSTKIVVEKYPEGEFEHLRNEISTSTPSTCKPIPIHATITVADNNKRLEIKEAISSSGISFIEAIKNEYMDYTAKLLQKPYELTLTQFKSGALLLQGSYTGLVDKVVNIIDSIKPLSIEERALFFIPIESQSLLRDAITQNTDSIKSHLSSITNKEDEWRDFLFDNDKKTFVTGEALVEILANQPKHLPEYNFLVAICAKVFEGFLIKILISKNFFTLDEYTADPDIPDIGNALRKEKLKKYIKDSRRYGYISEKLISMWEGSRCKEMHSDPVANMAILSVPNLQAAKDKIVELTSCMKEAFNILIKFGLNDADLAIQKAELQDVEPGSIGATKVRSDGYIGTDESGKGDYFGPLVIAGVFLDPITEKKLADAGVRDSKKISDGRIREYADMIRSYLPRQQYSVVAIGPEKYNELYQKIANLNHLLAWGHARVIENILANVDCLKVISDQFGDESLIKKALMEKGKKIELLQMPKAEQHTAVAAASILAREDFLNRLADLGKVAGMQLPKGASIEVEKTARLLLEKHGYDALKKYVKIHFKTTAKIH